MDLANNSTVGVTENSNLVTRINNKVYNLFVDRKNIKSDLLIPLSNINGNITAANEQYGSQTNESYTIKLTQKATYAKFFERSMNVRINVQGVVTRQRNVGFQIGAAAQTFNLAQGVNANPYNNPLLRFVCDPLNSMIDSINITIGQTNTSISCAYTPDLVNVIRKMSNPDIVYNYYQGLLAPETFNHNYKVNCSSDDLIMGYKITESGGQNIANTESYAFLSGVCDVDDLNTVLGYDRRNIFTNAEYKFEKTLASQNYKWDTTDPGKHKFVNDGAPSTVLYTIKLGEYFYPTNVSNWSDYLNDTANLGYAALLYYTDKRGLIGVGDTATPVNYTYIYEPPGQTMNIQIILKDLRSPVLHPLLDDLPVNSFSNCKEMKMIITLHAELYDRLCYNIYKPGVGESLGKATLTIDSQSQKLRYHQIDLGPLARAIKPTISLPYFVYNNTRVTQTIDQRQLQMAVGNGTYTGFDKKEFEATIDISNKIPKYLLLYMSSKYSVPYRITRLDVSIGGGANIMLQTIDQLIDASRDNGLRLRPQDQFNDWHVLTSFKHSKKIQSQTGTPLLLQFGTNIPLPATEVAMAPLMSGSNVNISYKVTVEFDFPYSDMQVREELVTGGTKQNIVTMNFTHITEGMVNIHDDVADQDMELITKEEYVEGVKAIADSSNDNDLSMNKAEIISGGTGRINSREVVRKHRPIRSAGSSTIGGSAEVGGSKRSMKHVLN